MIEYSLECQMFYFRDLGSTNGSVAVIKEDDRIKIKGDMKFKLENVPFRIMELPWLIYNEFCLCTILVKCIVQYK